MGLIVQPSDGSMAPIEWLMAGLIPMGYVSLLGAREGTGKTALLTSLAWQMTRPSGELLGRAVPRGVTLYVNFDAPGAQGRSVRRFLDAAQAHFPDGRSAEIDIIEPDAETYALGEGDLAIIRDRAAQRSAKLIVFDAYMSLFPLKDPSKIESVMYAMAMLRQLADELQVAVLLVDHLPKPAPGERALARGVFGSVAKMAQARSVHLLRRVREPATKDRHIVDWTVHKNTFAAVPEPFAVEFDFSRDGLSVDLVNLPGAGDERPGAVAMRAMHNALVQSRDDLIARKKLLTIGAAAAGVTERTAETALHALIETLGPDLQIVTLPSAGAPKAYRLLPAERAVTTRPSAAASENVQGPSQTEIALPKADLRRTASAEQSSELTAARPALVKGEL